MKIIQYRDSAMDARVSMDVYADRLFGAVKEIDPQLEIEQYTPKTWFTSDARNTWRARADRYLSYPLQARRSRADLHHVLDHGYAHLANRFSGGRTVCTVHDLIPYLTWTGQIRSIPFPGEAASPLPRKPTLNIYSLERLHLFDHVIAISECTKKDLVKHFGLANERISVIPLGVPDVFQPCTGDEQTEYLRKLGWSQTPEVKRVLVTGMQFYKNHETALQVFAKIHQQSGGNVRLVRAGQPSQEFDNWVKRLGLTDSVDTVFVSDHREMALLYNNVDCLLFPSLYEGFGMPPVEAMACGTPVVTSNAASLPEVTPDFAAKHAPDDQQGMVESVMTALSDEQLICRFRTEGPIWTRQFLWSKVAKQTLNLYQDLLAGG